MNFNSHTDSVVHVAAEVVNVGTPGWKQGREYTVPQGRELTTGMGAALRTGQRRARTPDDSRASEFVELAAALRPVFTQTEAGDADGAARTVNELLERFGPTPYLDRHDDEPWHLHFHGHERRDPSGWGGGCAVGLATVLGSDYADRLGVCRAPNCDRVFVDVSRNGTRRFCSTACQNRVKSAAHRARTAR